METELLQNIKEEDEFIKGLINLIPPRYFFDTETCEKINEKKHKEWKNKLKNNKGLRKKIISKKLKLTTKHRRAKLDPDLHKTVTDMQIEIYQCSTANGDESSSGIEIQATKHMELQEKLKRKLDELKGNRNASNQQIEKKRLKRRLSKLKLKNKRKKEKSMLPFTEHDAKVTPRKLIPNGDNSFNKSKGIIFSKIDLPETNNKKKHGNLSGKDFKSLLKKVETEKEKIDEIMVKDPERATTLKEKKLWMKALHKAEGVKVKDNPVLLKRTLQKKEQLKVQRKKKWSQREKAVKDRMEMHQKRRHQNIAAKKKEKVKKKIKRAIKKGRYISGF